LDKLKRSTKNVMRIQLVAKLNPNGSANSWPTIRHRPARDLCARCWHHRQQDIQVDPADLQKMAGLVRSEFEPHLMPDLTHLLRSEPGQPSCATYKQQIARPIDSQVLQTISDGGEENLRLTHTQYENLITGVRSLQTLDSETFFPKSHPAPAHLKEQPQSTGGFHLRRVGDPPAMRHI